MHFAVPSVCFFFYTVKKENLNDWERRTQNMPASVAVPV